MASAIILAGGTGRRLYPLTRYTPKPFLKLAGYRLYQYSLNIVSKLKPYVETVVVVTPPGWPTLPDPVPGWAQVVEQEGNGIGAGLAAALKTLGAKNGEDIVASFTGFLASPETIGIQVLESYFAQGYKAVMAVTPVNTGAETYGFVDVDHDGRVRGYNVGLRENWMGGRGYVFAGIIIGQADAFEVLAEHGFENGLNILAKRGVLGAALWTSLWAEIAFPWDILKSLEIIIGHRPSIIHPSAQVARSAVISGSVIIGRNASIGENVIVRGPAYIGKNSRIGDGAIVRGSIVEDDAIVGENSVLVDSIAMEASRIGPLSVLKRSIVGERAELGAMVVFESGKPENLPPGKIRNAAIQLGFDNIDIGCIVAPHTKVASMTLDGYGKVLE